MDFCERILGLDGAGHSAAIHSASKETLDEFARRMPVGRILANTPGSTWRSGANYRTGPVVDTRLRYVRWDFHDKTMLLILT